MFRLIPAPGRIAVLSAFLALPVHAQVIFSEYVEGTSNNKALELYNAGDAAVDLSQYVIEHYQNGAATPSTPVSLEGSLAPKGVFVVAHTSMGDTLGARVNLAFDLRFNGDDAVVLRHQGNVVDRIGQVGVRPTDEWRNNDVGTKDQTLRRKAEIVTGDTAMDAPFDPSAQWEGFKVNDFDGLGAHPGLAQEAPPAGGVAQCGVPATLIADLQGRPDGATVENVHVEAVVTASYTHATGFSGFFVQQAEGQRVRRPGISEGLFVYAPGKTVQPGQLVHLIGTVEERFGQTQLALKSDVAVCADGQVVQPESLSLPLADGMDYAQYEGMLVAFPQTLVVNDVYDLGRYGSITLADGLLLNPTHAADPGADARALRDANSRRRILLDDGHNHQNPAVVPYPDGGLSADNTLRRGHTVTGVQGVLEIRYDAWRLQPLPDADMRFQADANPRSQAPQRAQGTDLRVVAFNVLNYFNGDGQGGGFPTSRGAVSAEELARQEDKIVAALLALDADIIGLMEIENDGYGEHSAVSQLAKRLGSEWRYVDPGLTELGTDVIAVALLYRADRVREAGQAASMAIDDKSRNPLAQTFAPLSDGVPLTVAVNHFKSKGCNGATDINVDQDDGQSCWNPVRVEAAKKLTAWLAGNPTGVENAGNMIIGDLNSYAREEPISVLADAGYRDLLALDGQSAAYSYVFMGESGYLDHALADEALTARVRKAQTWNINADEPLALQYTLQYKSPEQQAAFYAPDAYRSSDHDPVIVDLAMAKDAPPQPEVPETPEQPGTPGTPEVSPVSPVGGSGGGGGALGAGLALLAALSLRRRQSTPRARSARN